MGLAALEGVLRLHLAGAPLPLDRLWPDRGGPPRPPGAAAGGAGRPRSSPPRPSWAAARRRRRPSPARRWRCPATTPSSPGCAWAIRRSSATSARAGCILDLRTVAPEDDDRLIAAVQAALRIQNPKSKIYNAHRPHPDRRGPRLPAPHAGAGARPGGVRGGGGGGRPGRHPAARRAPLRLRADRPQAPRRLGPRGAGGQPARPSRGCRSWCSPATARWARRSRR